MRMSPPKYHGSNVYKVLIEFIDEAYQIVAIIGLTLEEKIELVACQLQGMDKVWVEERGNKVGPIAWEEFNGTLLDWFFSLLLREAKMQEFINFKQDNISMREYSLMFTKISKYVCKDVDVVRPRWSFKMLVSRDFGPM